jgi:hypothetical protein
MLAGLRQKLAYGSDRWNTRQHNPLEAYAFTLWRLVVSWSPLYRTSLKIARLCQRPFVGKDKMIKRMAGLASGWTDERDLPPIAKKTFTEIWQEKHPTPAPKLPLVTKEEDNA